MGEILKYIFVEPFPWPWMVQDVIAIILSLIVLVYIVKRHQHPIPLILEAFAFVFFYASIYENAAIVMGLYSYGRSIVMIGFVPLSVPLIEVCVLITAFWFLEKTRVPDWAKPPIIGFFGMLQDFSLDPLAIRQVFNTTGIISGRWNWLIASTDVNILKVPVFNFPGWMLILFYGSACLLIGRWVYKKSGYKPMVGLIYPFVSIFAALLILISPLSNFLLWLGPFFQKGSSIEWVMLAFHLIIPMALLIFLWGGRMNEPFTKDDLPIFLVPIVLHLSDIFFTIIGGFYEILWIVILASIFQIGLMGFAFWKSQNLVESLE